MDIIINIVQNKKCSKLLDAKAISCNKTTLILQTFGLVTTLNLGSNTSATGDPPSLATGQTELTEKECFASLFSRNISLSYIEAILQLAGE